MRAIIIIPARLESKRLPGKLLLSETGKPLIQHTWEAACKAELADRVIIATDSHDISEVAYGFGAEVIRNDDCQPTGTDRVALVSMRLEESYDCVINLQADEPAIDPAMIDLLIQINEPLGTLATPIRNQWELASQDAVKIVVDDYGMAMYCSRSLIPEFRDTENFDEWWARHSANDFENPIWLRHVGVYTFRQQILDKVYWRRMPQKSLELAESLEQLRWMQSGWRPRVAIVPSAAQAVNTRQDYVSFRDAYLKAQNAPCG